MKREKQLEYCTKCRKQAFNPEEGIICSITNRKADFEDICGDFELDESKVEEIQKKRYREKKTGVSFGFSPRQTEAIEVADLTKKELLVAVSETIRRLDWNISYCNDSEMVAYTKLSMLSWSEEIRITIEFGNLTVKSECTGNQLMDWGKNKKNLKVFKSTFHEVKSELGGTNIEERYLLLSKGFVSNSDSVSSPLSLKEKTDGVFSLLIPSSGYFITPILVILNILVFVGMLIDGAHIILPANEILVQWGANFRPLTVNGEWWRLITSTFLHIGIFHLLMNLYALVYIGLLLEPYLGRARFLTAYLLTGIAGSVASVFWNELTISAGASGAIFGMYGVFIALLTTRMIERSARKALLISMGVFVVYNLVNGLKEGIDNAAHIGGLISGLVIGYSFYPSLVKQNPALKPVTIGILAVLFGLGSFVVIANTNSDIGKYEKDMALFAKLEQEALRLYMLPETTTDGAIIEEIRINGIRKWKDCLKVIERMDSYELPDAFDKRNQLLKDYIRLRINSYENILRAVVEQTDSYDWEINRDVMEIEKIINKLSEMK